MILSEALPLNDVRFFIYMKVVSNIRKQDDISVQITDVLFSSRINWSLPIALKIQINKLSR